MRGREIRPVRLFQLQSDLFALTQPATMGIIIYAMMPDYLMISMHVEEVER
jgi:hypothetical protein